MTDVMDLIGGAYVAGKWGGRWAANRCTCKSKRQKI